MHLIALNSNRDYYLLDLACATECKMAGRRTCLSVLVFLLHLLVIKAKFCANKPSGKVSIKSGYLTDGLPNAICHDVSDWKGFCWCYTRDKGWRRHIGFGAGRSFCIEHGAKAHTSFTITILSLCGDICPNPGPRNIKYPCGICKKAVRTNQDGILCDVCERWFHTRRQCLNMSEETYKAYSDNVNLQWICNRCSDIQRDEADLNTTCENEGFTSVKNSLSEHPGLEVGHMNVNGLRGKLSEVRMLLQNTGLDILAITETKITGDTTDDEIGIDSYCIVRKDRDSNGGGVMLYYKDTLIAYGERKLKVVENIEGTFISVKSQSQTWLVASVYRPPDNYAFYDKFNDMLEKIWSSRKNIIIMGDLNSDLLYRGRTIEESYLGRRLQRILSTYGLKCVIKEPTRISENAQTLIDLIIVSNPDKVTNTGVSHLGISDHSLVYANVRMRKEKQQLITKTVKNYIKLDSQSFKADIESAPWSVCEVFDDLNDQVWAWQHMYKQIASEHIPTRKIRKREGKLPWINSKIKKEQNKRYHLLRLYKNNKDPGTWKLYKDTRNRVKKLLRKAEIQYWREQFAEADNSKKFWQVVRKAQG